MRRRVMALFTVSGVALIASILVPLAQPTDHASPQLVRDSALVDAVTWGVTPSSMAAFQSAGRDKWLQSQLHPPAATRLPEAAQSQIDALPLIHESAFDLATKFDVQARTANQMTDVDQKAAAQQAFQQAMTDVAKQAATRSVLRALYAPDQLRERMTWFWFNHFNVRARIGDFREIHDGQEIADYMAL
jgi:uncharacterized protein (DUF1800 family)